MTEVTSERVTLPLVRAAGITPRALYAVFTARGLDWTDFTANGITVAELRAVEPALADRLAAALVEAQEAREREDKLRVYIRHTRAVDMCSPGSRRFFANHGFSWSDFLDNGISVADLRATGDPLAEPAIKAAIAEENNGRR